MEANQAHPTDLGLWEFLASTAPLKIPMSIKLLSRPQYSMALVHRALTEIWRASQLPILSLLMMLLKKMGQLKSEQLYLILR